MTLIEKIKFIYPEIKVEDLNPMTGLIVLKDDSDGKGPYIAKWEYLKPEPTKKQLDAIETLLELNPELLVNNAN